MRYETLDPLKTAKDANGNQLPNIVTVTNAVRRADELSDEDKKAEKKAPELKLQFPAELMKFKQYDSLAEFVTECESEKRALEVINDVTAKFATSAGKTAIRTATTGTEDEIIQSGLRACLDFTWKEEVKLSAKDKAQMWDTLMAEAKNLTPEQIAARVAEMSAR